MNFYDKKTELYSELQKINEDIERLNYLQTNIIYEQDLEYLTLLALEKIKKFYDYIINDYDMNKNYSVKIAYLLDKFDDSDIKNYKFTKERYERLNVYDHPKLLELYPSYKSAIDKKEYLEKIYKQTNDSLQKDKIIINNIIDKLNEDIVLYNTISNSSSIQLEKLQ